MKERPKTNPDRPLDTGNITEPNGNGETEAEAGERLRQEFAEYREDGVNPRAETWSAASEASSDLLHQVKLATDHACTDVANGERLAKHAAGRLLFAHGLGWLAWDGKRWARDEDGEVEREAKAVARAIYAEAAATDGQTARGQISRWAVKSEQRSSQRAMIEMAASEAVLRERAEAFDSDPEALNCANGVLDLRHGGLSEHDPRHRHTKVTAGAFDPTAEAPTWEAFLQRVLPDESERAWVQKAAGASLVGRFSEHLFFAYGEGANGKSTFLAALRHALGDYAQEAPEGFLQLRYGDRNAGDEAALARTRGARLVTTAEAEEGRRLAEVFVKRLTGEATLTAKLMRQDPFEFENQATFWLSANHKPVIRGMDLAIRRRIKLIPFTVTIPESERDPRLADKLAAEADGILRWAFDGYRAFRRDGLDDAPPAVAEATRGYFTEMDPIAAWIDECCERDAAAWESNGKLRASYEAHCKRIGERHPLPPMRFASALDKHGVPATSERQNGKRGRVGLRVNDNGDDVLGI